MGDISNGSGISLIRDGDFKIGASGISAGFTGISLVTQRTFITADRVLKTHFTMQNAVTFAGDFEFSFLFSGSSLDIFDVFASDSATGQILARVNNAFQLNAVFGTGGVDVSGTTNINDGKLHLCTVRRVGQVGSILVDGVLENSVDDAGILGDQVVDEFARRFTSNHIEGVFADPTLTDITTPSNSESWRLDRPFPTTTEQSSSGSNLLTYVNADSSTRESFTLIGGDWVGIERIINGSFVDNSDWSVTTGWTLSNGLTVSGAANNSNITQGNVVEPGDRYLFLIDITSVNSGELDINLGNSNRFGNFTTPGIKTGIETAIGATSVFLQSDQSLSFDGNVKLFSIKRILETA